MANPSIHAAGHDIRLEGDLQSFTASLTARPLAEGLAEVKLVLASPQPALPPRVSLAFEHPAIDIQSLWHPGAGRNRSLPVNWMKGFTSMATRIAPVICLHGTNGRNRLTFACSDGLNPIYNAAGLSEETAQFQCRVGFFTEPHPPISRYEARLLIDTQDLPYHQCLDHVQRWWAAQEGYEPSGVPETARLPMYSSWYSFHQQIEPEEVVKQCRLAAPPAGLLRIA